MNIKQIISVIDSHTAGEPTRIITDGFPRIKGETMAKRMDYLKNNMDWLRKSLMHEPRGHRAMFGGILMEPIDPSADIAVIFMDGGKYYNMCGHGSLGILAMMVETGRVDCRPGKNIIRIETPAGIIEGTVITDNDNKIEKVSFVNVPSFAWALDKKINVPGFGQVSVDIGFGGSFFVIVEAEQLGIKSIDSPYMMELIKTGVAVRSAANEQIQVQHPTKEHIRTIDLCMITAPPSCKDVDARNVVIHGEAQADRSSCGTGTCARMAVLHRKGKLSVGRPFRHESMIKSVLNGMILSETTVADIPAVIPEVGCRPFITGFHRFIIDPQDPFAEGFAL